MQALAARGARARVAGVAASLRSTRRSRGRARGARRASRLDEESHDDEAGVLLARARSRTASPRSAGARRTRAARHGAGGPNDGDVADLAASAPGLGGPEMSFADAARGRITVTDDGAGAADAARRREARSSEPSFRGLQLRGLSTVCAQVEANRLFTARRRRARSCSSASRRARGRRHRRDAPAARRQPGRSALARARVLALRVLALASSPRSFVARARKCGRPPPREHVFARPLSPRACPQVARRVHGRARHQARRGGPPLALLLPRRLEPFRPARRRDERVAALVGSDGPRLRGRRAPRSTRRPARERASAFALRAERCRALSLPVSARAARAAAARVQARRAVPRLRVVSGALLQSGGKGVLEGCSSSRSSTSSSRSSASSSSPRTTRATSTPSSPRS